MSRSRRFVVAAAQLLLAACFTLNAYAQPRDREGGHGHQHEIRHVLLVSIDGMHALDFRNCAKGISGVNGGKPYCPHLAALARNGVDYLDTTTSKPSDSFPGLMALVSGGSPRTVGAFYDVAFDRSLDPPKDTTGNGVAGGSCTPGGTPIGTTTEYDEGIDIDQTKLNGGAPSGDGGINAINSNFLVRDPKHGCAPVFPWNFVRTNTIFGVVHHAGGYTAWTDKHPSILQCRVLEMAATLTITIRRRSIQPWSRCRE
jgi:Type I phosphodiesterase / nucleotide pyrophosphatase